MGFQNPSYFTQPHSALEALLGPLADRYTGKPIQDEEVRLRAAAAQRAAMDTLTPYRPQNMFEGSYDRDGRIAEGIAGALGQNPRAAARKGAAVREAVRGVWENTLAPSASLESAKSIAGGDGGLGDYANMALLAAPFVGGTVARGVRAITPAPVREAVERFGRYAVGTPTIDMPQSFTRGGLEIFPEGAALGVGEHALPMGGRGGTSLAVMPGEAPDLPSGLGIGQRALPDYTPPPPLGLDYRPLPQAPEGAAKLRGGQWWPDAEARAPLDKSRYEVIDRGEFVDRDFRYALKGRESGEPISVTYSPTPEGAWRQAERWETNPVNYSPEAAARFQSAAFPSSDPRSAWLRKAMTKYFRNDLGSPSDPLFDLADRGLHPDPDMTREGWLQAVNDMLGEDDVGALTLPQYAGGLDIGPQLTSAAPWLHKLPVTDKLWSIMQPPDMGSFLQGFEALTEPPGNRWGVPDLPADLRLDLERLDRVSFPQAAERVGRYNQWKAAEAEKLAAERAQSPALQVHKEYPDGMRWVQLRKPEGAVLPRSGNMSDDELLAELSTEDPGYKALADALQWEGDTMGHCVGGYCADVAADRSRIFSLRDAAGNPHITVETEPGGVGGSDWQRLGSGAIDDDSPLADVWNMYGYGDNKPVIPQGTGMTSFDYFPTYVKENHPDLYNPDIFDAPRDHIQQIKGKGNTKVAPKYLQYAQDFVKSGNWGNVDDLFNAGLVKLPDGRFMDEGHYNQIIEGDNLDTLMQGWDFNSSGFPRNPARMRTEDWEQFRHHFDHAVDLPPLTRPAGGSDVSQLDLRGWEADDPEIDAMQWVPELPVRAPRRHRPLLEPIEEPGEFVADPRAQPPAMEPRDMGPPVGREELLRGLDDAINGEWEVDEFAAGGPVRIPRPVIRMAAGGRVPRPVIRMVGAA